MVQWGMDPVRIRTTWTRELLDLMIRKCGERIERQNPGPINSPQSGNGERVSGEDFLNFWRGN